MMKINRFDESKDAKRGDDELRAIERRRAKRETMERYGRRG